MATKNRRNVVIGDSTWEKLRKLAKIEERNMSDLIREAILDLFDKRIKPDRMEYDPITDNYQRK